MRRHRRLQVNAVFALAICILVLLGLLSLAAPWIATKWLRVTPTQQDLYLGLTPWASPGHILGTDELGRDLLVRILYGGRLSLGIATLVTSLHLLIGASLGLASGYYGGRVDDAINGILQVVRGIPLFFLLIVFSMLFRPSPLILAIVLGLLGWTGMCRQVRALVLSVRQRSYVEAAQMVGARNGWILVRHILPNVVSVILVVATFNFADVLILEAGLSYLGFGVQPPTPSWGNLLTDALFLLQRAPWLTVVPGMMISVTVLSVFLLGDGLRDMLDPATHIR